MSHRDFLNKAIRGDSGAWFEQHGKIWPKDRDQGLITPRANYLQAKVQDVLRKFEELNLPVRILGLKPRQRGSTTYFSCIDYTYLRRQSTSACVIGGQYSQTHQLWGMLQTYQRNDTFDGWGNTGEINEKEGKWSHGSKLIPETAKDVLAGISGTHQVLHCTEVARWAEYGVANAAEVLTNVLKCVPLKSRTVIILESTASGATGDYFTRFKNAVDSHDFLDGNTELQPGQYVRVFAPWFEFADSALRLTAEQKKEIQRTLDAEDEYLGEKMLIEKYSVDAGTPQHRLGESENGFDVWEQLAWRRWSIREECKRDKAIFDRDYPHSWETAFQKSGTARFNQTGLGVQRRRIGDRAPIYGVVEETKEHRMVFRPTEKHEAKIIQFEPPYAGRYHLLAVDPMTGATQVGGKDPDMHGVFVLRKGYFDREGRWARPGVVARIIQCRWDIDVLEEQIWRLARLYGAGAGCKIAVEMEMDRGLTELLKLRGADLYEREIFNQREMRTSKALGWMTTAKTREVIVENMARAIREWDRPGDGFDIFDANAVEQFENFVVKESGRSEAAAGYHDDDVLALCIGLQLIDHATAYVPERFFGNVPPDLRETPPGPQNMQFS